MREGMHGIGRPPVLVGCDLASANCWAQPVGVGATLRRIDCKLADVWLWAWGEWPSRLTCMQQIHDTKLQGWPGELPRRPGAHQGGRGGPGGCQILLGSIIRSGEIVTYDPFAPVTLM